MGTASERADALEGVLRDELPRLRAIPDGEGTTRSNRPSGRGWSRREELGHLVDSAVDNHGRFVRAALEGSYAGPGYAQEGWVEAHGYRSFPWPALVEVRRAHNEILVPLIRGIPDARLGAPCRIGDAAPIPLGALIDDYVLHVRHHLDRILPREGVAGHPPG